MTSRKFPKSFKNKDSMNSNSIGDDVQPSNTVFKKMKEAEAFSSRSYESYTIGGVLIKFPFKAYPCQLNMMQKACSIVILK
jgi:hypothetical protein